ncbi:hypothetical protein V6N13_088899 [Hibiscus sabdariffa]
MSNVRIRDLPEGIVFGNLESFFSNLLHKMGQVLPEAIAVFINCFEELDPDITTDLKSKCKQYLNVGPFILATQPPPVPDSHGCLSWVDKQKPATVAYISFGDKLKVLLSNGFLEKANDIIVPWAPQTDVLAHGAVGVFITHGGWNSLVESIAGGVPKIFRPFFGDHRVNGRMFEDVWKIGVIVESGVLTKDGIISGLNLVLAQKKGKEMRENLREIKQVAQTPVGAKGSSTEIFKKLLDLVCGQN